MAKNPKLVLKRTTDKTGRKTSRWIDPDKDKKAPKRSRKPEEARSARTTKREDTPATKLVLRDLDAKKLKKLHEVGKKMLKEHDGNTKHLKSKLKEVEKHLEKNGEKSGKPKDIKDEVVSDLKKLAKMGAESKEAGGKAPNFNLCDISIPNTNLFCKNNKGVPREKMPQLKGEPEKGTPADKLEKKKGGEVDAEDAFEAALIKNGATITTKAVNAETLKSTQNELVGVKVAQMMEALEKDPEHAGITAPILISKDGYVLDGHHRWAAMVASKMNTGEPPKMAVRQVDMEIKDLLKFTNKFTKEFGLKQKSADANDESTGQLKDLSPELRKKVARKGKGEGARIGLRPKEVAELLEKGVVGFVSAGRNPANDEDMKLDEKAIEARYKKLEGDLVDLGYQYVPVLGKYGEEEDSFMVMAADADKDDMIKLGEKYNQDSVIFSDHKKNELIYTTGKNKGKEYIGEGYNKLSNKVKDFWSEVTSPKGEKFRFNLNFNFNKLKPLIIKKAIKLLIRL